MKLFNKPLLPSRLVFLYSTVILCCFLLASCKKEEPIPTGPTRVIDQEFPIVYNAQLPDGKLPYPHHDPIISQMEYSSLVDDLFIINNFGLYQCGDQVEDCYFHDGLDFVLENGTPIFALEEGTVRANIGGNTFYRTLVIEDEDEPGFAWTYTHVYNFAVEPGELVSQGQYLARVNFQGLEHIHLNRTRLREGGQWSNFEDLINIYPDDYFTFTDSTNPIVKTPFHFFRNGTDSIFRNDGPLDTISGEVDIVVSMRDGGIYAGNFIGNSGYWGDRLAVRDITYRILKEEEEISFHESFDFRNLEFAFHTDRWREVKVVFKHGSILDQDAGDHNMFHSHYIITNARPNHIGQIRPEDESNSWNTLELESGQLKYPNGLYQIEVIVHDSNGNETIKRSQVYVKN